MKLNFNHFLNHFKLEAELCEEEDIGGIHPVNLHDYYKIPTGEFIRIESYPLIPRNNPEISITPERGYINSALTVSTDRINTTIIIQSFYPPIKIGD